MSDTLMSGTYKTLPEQKEVLSPTEERFEKLRQTVGLVLGPVAFLIVYFAPLDLEPNQQTLAAVLVFDIAGPDPDRAADPPHGRRRRPCLMGEGERQRAGAGGRQRAGGRGS